MSFQLQSYQERATSKNPRCLIFHKICSLSLLEQNSCRTFSLIIATGKNVFLVALLCYLVLTQLPKQTSSHQIFTSNRKFIEYLCIIILLVPRKNIHKPLKLHRMHIIKNINLASEKKASRNSSERRPGKKKNVNI
jgi:hypothetical protein